MSANTLPLTPEQAARSAAKIAQQSTEFHSQFEEQLEGAKGNGQGYQDPGQLRGKRRQQWEQLVALRQSFADNPPRPATIVNLCPWELRVNGVVEQHEIVPPCPIGRAFVTHIVRRPVEHWREMGDDNRSAEGIQPIRIAREFEREFTKEGGVVVYVGDHSPETDPKVKEQIKTARAKLTAHMKRVFQAADVEMRRPGGPRVVITENDRIAGAWLKHEGLLPEDPKWLNTTREEAKIAEACPACQSEDNKRGAVLCTNCKYILDPMRAFELAIIGPDEPALQRLTRAELDSVGLTEVESRTEKLDKVKGKHKKQQ